MKKLLLIRHAKAEKDSVGKDFDRPLKYPGIQDARFMADHIREAGIIPQLVVTSPALQNPNHRRNILRMLLNCPTPKKKNLSTKPINKTG